MERSILLARRIQEVILDGTWIAQTNCKKALSDVSWQMATKKVGNLNTIAALTFHIQYYITGFLQVFEEGKLEIKDQFSFDFDAITDQQKWHTLKEMLFQNTEKLISYVEKMEDIELSKPFVKEEYGSFLRNIDGLIEHSYYHLGQISLLKKLIQE